jgi:hypothetical protein
MTFQTNERFLENGKVYPLVTEPLRPLLEQHAIDARSFCEIWATHCYRGYLASWDIHDGILLLHDIEVIALVSRAPAPAELKNRLLEITASQKFPIFASWFSGVLRIGMGERYRCRHGFGIYPEERVIEVGNGRVVGERWQRNANPLTHA